MKPKVEATTAPLTVIGVDIGKDVFHLVGTASTERSRFEEDQAAASERCHEIKGACVFSSRPRSACRSTDRIHISNFRPHALTCEEQPVQTKGA